MSYRLASAILKGKWAIDPLFALNAFGTIIPNIISGAAIQSKEDPSAEPVIFSPSANSADGYYINRWTDLDKIPAGSVALIQVKGTLMKDNQECGPVGMATLGQRFITAHNHQNIVAIVLDVDSPGGTVDGTEDFANIIRSAVKPVVGFVNGLAASAALWIVSQARQVVANNLFAEIGSVGVLMQFWDVIPAYEKEGYKYHQIISSLSPDKVKMFNDLRAGKYDDYRKFQLDPLAEHFQSVIREVRPNVKDEHLTGKVFFAKDVMDVFVDKIGTINDAINLAVELAREQSNSQSSNNSNNYSSKAKQMKNFVLLAALMGAALEADAEGFMSFNEEQLDKIESALAELDKAKADLTTANTSLTTVKSQLDTANGSITTITAERDTAKSDLTAANATIEDLRKRVPGAESANHKGKTEVTETIEDDAAEQKKLGEMSMAERVAYIEARDKK